MGDAVTCPVCNGRRAYCFLSPKGPRPEILLTQYRLEIIDETPTRNAITRRVSG